MSRRDKMITGVLALLVIVGVLVAAWPPKKFLYSSGNRVTVYSQDATGFAHFYYRSSARVDAHRAPIYTGAPIDDAYVEIGEGKVRGRAKGKGFGKFSAYEFPVFVDNGANYAVGVNETASSYRQEEGRAQINVSIFGSLDRPMQKDIILTRESLTKLMNTYIDPSIDLGTFETVGWLEDSVYAFSNDVRSVGEEDSPDETVFVIWLSTINRCIAFDLERREQMTSSPEKQEEWLGIVRSACDKGFRWDWRPTFTYPFSLEDGRTRCTYFYLRNPEGDMAEFLQERFADRLLRMDPARTSDLHKRHVTAFEGEVEIGDNIGGGPFRWTGPLREEPHEFGTDYLLYSVPRYKDLDYALGIFSKEFNPQMPPRRARNAWYSKTGRFKYGPIFLGGASVAFMISRPENPSENVLSICFILDDADGPWAPRAGEGECTYLARIVRDEFGTFSHHRIVSGPLGELKLVVQGLVPGKYRIEASLHTERLDDDYIVKDLFILPETVPETKNKALLAGRSLRFQVTASRVTTGIVVEMKEIDGGLR